MTKFKPSVYASQEFLIGKALSDDAFRVNFIEYFKAIKGLTEEHQKLLNALSHPEFSLPYLTKEFGKPTLAFAMELWDRYDKQMILKERFSKLEACK